MAVTAPLSESPWLEQIEQHMTNGAFAPALAMLLPLLERGQHDLRLLTLAATCYWKLGDHATAVALMRVVVQHWPDDGASWGRLGSMALYSGETELARMAYENTVRCTPRSAPALAALNRLAPFTRGDRHVRRLREITRDRRIPAPERVLAHNALGRVEEAAGNFKPAFHQFARSNALKSASYHPEAIEEKVADQIRLFDPDVAPMAEGEGPRFVFIVGLPRSGTTLVESILTRHPGVVSIGESLALSETLRQLAGSGGPWDWIKSKRAEDMQAARAVFLQRAGINENKAARVIVDKMPMDCLDLALARLILPEARFVFMQRHPLDVGLSNFVTNFDRGNGFSTRLDWIGHITRMVWRSIDDYADKLGPVLRRQSYRVLVETPEPQIRALLDHVGLEWNNACLAPEKAERAVHTASMLQVREKINRKGLGKWRDYAEPLEPLVKALGGWSAIEQWEADDRAA